MKNFLSLSLFFLAVCLLSSSSVGEEMDIHSEFQAACELESLCTYTNFSGQADSDSETVWENGKLTWEDEDGIICEVPITEASVECECLDSKIIKQLMKLKHLRSLSIQLNDVQSSKFHIQELKSLEKFELYIDSEGIVPIPNIWGKSIATSQTIRTLQIPAQIQLVQEVAKMSQLQSLTLDDSGETNVLPGILPLKNSLRELVVTSESEPHASEILKNFRHLQVLSLRVFDFRAKNMDGFLDEIKSLPLRCFWLPYGQIGANGEMVLREWGSLEEVMLPKDFSDERFESLEKIQRPIQLSQKDGSKKIELRRKFFRDSLLREMSRPYRLDAQGNYIHWSELSGGIWL